MRNCASLISYFRSGWAFLIPYLAAYLLYAWLRWPVNAAAAGSMGQGAKSWIPCLLHVYWFLHALHLLLGVIALRAWWRSTSREQGAGSAEQAREHRPLDTVYGLLPWVFLGLLFYIPGVYMEFPADPWHHYARVNEWSWLQTVMDHSAWKKSSYFLGYSLIGPVSPPAFQLRWFDVYYTGCCLLLCWQYYRLARTIGLSERTSMVFVLLNTLIFGNNIFGFYRYYGMSSTVFAQLGAIALTRIVLESAKGSFAQNDERSLIHRIFLLLAHCSLLLALTAFNHVQGLGIAGLGIAAVVVWRLLEWRRSMIGWLALTAVGLSVATVLWWPRHYTLQTVYQTERWMTLWYGFNFFSYNSPAFKHALMILGAFGLTNLLAGLLLLLRGNSLIGWLTIMPFVALCTPFVAIPFATVLEDGLIFTFHRMLLAMPTGLALLAVGINLTSLPLGGLLLRFSLKTRVPLTGLILVILGLATLTTTPTSLGCYNRLFNVLMKPPHDLMMSHIIESSLVSSPQVQGQAHPGSRSIDGENILTLPGIAYVMNATSVTHILGARKWMTWPTVTSPSANAESIMIRYSTGKRTALLHAPYWPIPALYSTGSSSGHLSSHWLPYEVALEHAGQPELFSPPPAGQ